MCLEWFADRDKRKIKNHQQQKKPLRKTQRPLPDNLLHQAANGLGISGGVIHGQTFDQLCLCVQQGTVLVQLLGVASLLRGLQGGKHGVVIINQKK